MGWNKNQIKAINANKENDYEKDYMKIKFNSDDDLPLNKPLKFHAMTIIVRSVFEEDGKLYPQVFLDNALYEVQMLEYHKVGISEGIDVDKTSASKEYDICHFWYFKDFGFKYEPYLCHGFHDLMRKAMSFNDYRIHFWYMSKDDTIGIMNNSDLVDKKVFFNFFYYI